ncbi:MAG TPA: Cys-tRNA(Pro) deacylase [Candidatus Limnocylindria bacterium]|nr:Cys-tRNA(Pro) deacylase [Candidatus Limnocylindria bacterium]
MDKTNAMRMLEREGIPYEALEYPCPEGPLDAPSVAALLGEDPAHVFKTLVLMGSDGVPAVCVIPGSAELDLKRAAAAFGVKALRMLHVDELRPLTGYVRGGCSPLAMKKRYRTALDESALALDRVLVSGGRLGAQVRLRPADLAKASGALWARLTM